MPDTVNMEKTETPNTPLLDCAAVLAKLDADEEQARYLRAERGEFALPKINLSDPWGHER
jgi:hypothetical protein